MSFRVDRATSNKSAQDLNVPNGLNNSNSENFHNILIKNDKMDEKLKNQINDIDSNEVVLNASNDNNNNKMKKFDAYLKNELNQIRHAFEDDVDFHNNVEKRQNDEFQSVVIERQGGLANRFVLFLLFLWYLFSAFTLYTNKYIVSSKIADPTIVGVFQMIITSLCGFLQLKHTLWKRPISSQLIIQNVSHSRMQNYKSILFWRNMFIIGILRLFSIILGLMALKQSAISFVETVKSSSPIFTVFISQFMIGEITSFWTKVSLFPIMLGLGLCSSFEINFSLFGFLAAIFTNFTECLQNVFSKLLLCSDKYKFTPLEVQFFSSTTSCIVLIPICAFMVDFREQSYSLFSLFLYIINGVSFHCQTLLAFTLMSYISPVTHSVCNTLKRALLIWFSVYIFQNQVGYMSAIGTFLVIIGVLFYIHAKNMSKAPQTKSNEKKNIY